MIVIGLLLFLGVCAFMLRREVADLFGLGSTCKHGIDRDAYCVPCTTRRFER